MPTADRQPPTADRRPPTADRRPPGTIVGSAVFNLTVIIGGTAFFMPRALVLDWRPLSRDTACYAVAIVILIVTMRDHAISKGEALAYVGAYGLYVSLMVCNERLMAWMARWPCATRRADAAAARRAEAGGGDGAHEDSAPFAETAYGSYGTALFGGVALSRPALRTRSAVSYTHLTLPTKRIV